MRLGLGLLMALAALAMAGWHGAAGLGWGVAARWVACLGFVLVFAALLAALGQGVASVLDPDPSRSRGSAAMVVYFREFGHFLWCFGVAQPLLAWLMPWHRTPDQPRAVVVFAHGFLCNRGLWWRWRRAWHQAGFATVVLDLPPGYWSVSANLKHLQEALQAMALHHPGIPLCVVGHSMGGLIGRIHLSERQPSLAALVSLGAPHRGTQLAGQMGGQDHGPPVLSSPWLLAFNQQHPPTRLVRCINVWSANDCIVVPAKSCAMDAQTDWLRHRYGHMGLSQSAALCAETIKAVEAIIDQDDPGTERLQGATQSPP